MMEFNCKNITVAIEKSRELLDLALDQLRSSLVDEAEKSLEAAEKLTMIGPVKYRYIKRLVSDIPDNLKEGESFANGTLPCLDLSLSADGKNLSTMYKESFSAFRYFDYDPETWNFQENKKVIGGAKKVIFSKDGETIIAVTSDTTAKRIYASVKIYDKLTDRVDEIFKTVDGIKFINESKDGKFVYLIDGYSVVSIVTKDGKRIGSGDFDGSPETIFDLKDGFIAATHCGTRKNIVSLHTPDYFHKFRQFRAPEGEQVMGCIKSAKQGEYVYWSSKRIMIGEVMDYNTSYYNERELCRCERKLAGKSKLNEENLSYILLNLLESSDGTALFGLYDDGTICVWDRLSGRMIKEIKTSRNGVNFEKMQLLSDGSIAIGGTQGYAEKWGLR